VNSSTLTQLQIFADDILLPAFVDLKQLLENSEAKVFIVNHASMGIHEIDTMLQQMHLGKPYLANLFDSPSFLQEPPTNIQNFVGASLCVQRLQNIESGTVSIGLYCCSIELIVTSLTEIYATYTVGIMLSGQEQLCIRSHLSEDNFQPLDIHNIKINDIILHAIKSFEDFEVTLLSHKISPDKFLEIERFELDQTSYIKTLNYFEPTSLEAAEISIIHLSSCKNSDVLLPKIEQFIDPQILYDLSKQLAQTLAPQGFPIYSKLNPKLQHSAQIKSIQDRYQRTIDLSLEYSPAVTEAELIEYLHRLGHYQTLKHLAHLHIFVQEQIQAWYQQNGQPSLGSIAPHLQQCIIELRDHLYQLFQTLTDHQLDSAAHALETEVQTLTTQQQQQQTLLNHLAQNPLLGYLDTHLLDPFNRLEGSIQPFTAPIQPIDIPAKHFKAKNSKSILSHIASCRSEKYSAYHQRKQDRPELKLIIEYAITQKLYPQRPIFIGFAPKAVYPRLELLWGQIDESILNPSPLNQIWCIYPMMRTDPPQWLIMAATTDAQPLKTITLENGLIAEEGTLAYLERSLYLMGESEDEYTLTLSKRVTEALADKRVKYLHIHQTHDSQVGAPRDILQMQFQIFG
jgi:hypothetical protein